jgi:tetraacyldisaccharide 4'-kinase
VHVLDDGFQHRSLRRDLDIVAVTPDDLRDRRFPFGRLRDSPSALSRADAVVVDGAIDDRDRSHWTCPTFTMTRRLGEPEPIEPGHPVPARGSAVVALAGIAGPERFQRALEHAGWTVAALLGHRDHHRYSAADLARAAQALRDTGAAGILTTDKDAVRLRTLRPLSVPISAVPLDVMIEPAREFESWLFDSLRDIRARLSEGARA